MNIFCFKKYSFIVFFLLVLLSCESDVEITWVNPIILSVEDAEIFRIENEDIMNAFILDSFLIIKPYYDSIKIHVYNKDNLQLITKFGTAGMAPFELPFSFPLTNASITQKSNCILFYDIRTFQYKTINLDKYLSGGNVGECITSTPMDQELFFSVYLTQLDKNKFAARTDQPYQGMLFIYDTLKKEKKLIDYTPNKKIDERAKGFLYHGLLNANGSKNSLVYASRNFDQVLFYDLEGNLQKKHVFSSLKMPELNKNPIPGIVNPFLYALSTYATTDFCFVNRACQQFSSDFEQPLKPSQLLVFTWDGVMVKAFELPAVSTTSRFDICYDEEYGNLYSFYTSLEENDPHVIVRKYKIGNHLQTHVP